MKLSICILTFISLFFFITTTYSGEVDANSVTDAIIKIRAGSSLEHVSQGMFVLEKVAQEDLNLLLGELTNDETVSVHLQEPLTGIDSVTGEKRGIRLTNVSDVVLGVIQNSIEGRWPKYYYVYRVINKDNAREWITERKNKKISELRIEAAESALENVERLNIKTNSTQENDIIILFTNRLKEIKDGGTSDIKR